MSPRDIDLLWRMRWLSSLRIAKHGPVEDSGQWWNQITAIAAEKGVEMPTFAEWHNIGRDR